MIRPVVRFIRRYKLGGEVMENNQSEQLYDVVLNDEGQYSIWPVEKSLPLGWNKTGTQGVKEACLSYINEVWTDMRPISLRKQMMSAA